MKTANITIKKSRLFWASCLAILVEALSFGIRAGIMEDLMIEFHLTATEMGLITGTAFLGVPLAMIIGGMIVDIIGMKRLLLISFFLYVLGILLTILATGFFTLFISTLLIGIANGTVEAGTNPLITTIYPDKKTTKLNHLHLWFPAGIIIGAFVAFGFAKIGLGWQWKMAVMFIPALIYGYMFLKLDFPVTERVSAGYTAKDMYKSVITPLYIFMFICMLGTAVTELYTNQWVTILLHNVTNSAILILALVAAVQTIGRGVAGPVMKRVSPSGLLLASAIVSTIGLYLLSTLTGGAIYIGAVVFGLGVTYFWPTMLGFVSENIPESGAFGIDLLGGAGNFSVSIFMIFMGGYYDRLISRHLPAGAELDTYRAAAPGTEKATALEQAQVIAGPQVIETTNIIPLVLIFAFLFLFIYMRSKKGKSLKIGQKSRTLPF